MSDLDRLLASYYPLTGDVLRRYADGGEVKPDDGWLATAQKYNRAASHGIDQALFGFPSAVVHGARALYSGDWSGEAQRRLDAKEAGLSDLKDITPYGHKALMELTSMPVPSNPHSAINAIAAGAGKMVPAIFAGIAAKTAPLADLERAKAAEASGIPREQIWKDHGWFQGKDGKWRFEIDDSKASMVDAWGDNYEKIRRAHVPQTSSPGYIPQAITLEDYMRHPELERAYFPTREAAPSVIFDNLGPGTKGKYSPYNHMITMDSGQFLEKDVGKSTALHEIQHRVQNLEDFSPGYNPIEATKDIAQARLREKELMAKVWQMQDAHTDEAAGYLAKAASGDKHYQDFVKKAEDKWFSTLGQYSSDNPYGLSKQQAVAAEITDSDPVFRSIQKTYNDVFKTSKLDPHELYKMHAGETEARAVQKRMDLTPEQRRDRAPWLDYDVPEANQIIGTRR